jgi:hypothetical protein
MSRTIVLSDDQFARLEAAARLYHRSVDQVIADPPGWRFTPQAPALSTDERERRWANFMRLVGSIQQGALLSNEAIDALIG